MEIKYEAVFGDQSLFDSAEPDVFLVETDGVYKTFHKETTGKVSIWTRRGCDLAMRRIIRTPTWTVSDQKEGKLPPVGSVVMVSPSSTVTVMAVDSIQKVVAVQSDSQVLGILDIHEIKPIESPEEKAARLEDEFAQTVLKEIYYGSSQAMQAAEDAARCAYRKLSGDLPVPVKGE